MVDMGISQYEVPLSRMLMEFLNMTINIICDGFGMSTGDTWFGSFLDLYMTYRDKSFSQTRHDFSDFKLRTSLGTYILILSPGQSI